MNTPKLVGLDFDGVVVAGSNQAYFDAYHMALEAVGVKLDPKVEHERIIQGWGSGCIEQLEIILAEHPDKVEQAGVVWNEHVESEAFWEKVSIIKGCKEAIERMSRIVPVVVVSGTRVHHIEALLKEGGIQGVSAIYSSYDVASELKKPHPHTLQLALEKFNVVPEDTIYVGDMVNDIVMTRAAGARPVAVLTGELDTPTAESMEVEFIGGDLLAVANQYFPQ
ncbi:MAG: HAD family hydrolase [Parcubacteria group bacterium]|nr:HAD family hydrolase [Parcubacteria group bacterium]